MTLHEVMDGRQRDDILYYDLWPVTGQYLASVNSWSKSVNRAVFWFNVIHMPSIEIMSFSMLVEFGKPFVKERGFHVYKTGLFQHLSSDQMTDSFA